MNIRLKTAMIRDLETLGYEVSAFDKKIIDTIENLYIQIKDCDKELKKEGLLMEVDGKLKQNPRLDVKLKLITSFKSCLGMFPIDVKTKMTILIEQDMEEEVFGTDDDYTDSLILEM